jgi:hypothetical protein
LKILLLFRIFKGNKVVAACGWAPYKSLDILNCPVQSEVLVLFQENRVFFQNISDIYVTYFELTPL